MAESEQAESETVEQVDDAGHTGPLAEHDDSSSLRVDHFLVIDQSNLLQYAPLFVSCLRNNVRLLFCLRTLCRTTSSIGIFSVCALIVCEKKAYAFSGINSSIGTVFTDTIS